MSGAEAERSVAVVGGGLAGLATAVALAERGVPVELFEARRRLGGRASSWLDPASGEMVDFCQHVGMACCTNFADFCRRTGIAASFRRAQTLHFFGPDGRRYDLQATPGLPAPLHLLSSFLRLGYLSWRERFGVIRALGRLARWSEKDGDDLQTIGTWLRKQKQSPQAVERFWAPVIVGALGESPERASLKYARKVFVDGFLRHRDAYQIDVPSVPLSELFGDVLPAWLRERGAVVHSGLAVREVRRTGAGNYELDLGDGVRREAAQVVVALPWRKAADLLAGFRREWPAVDAWRTIAGAPISGVHLWFDRPLTELPHAVLVGTLSQWLFRREASEAGGSSEFYYQVVISASYDLDALDRDAAVERIVAELRRAFPQAAEARLLRHRIVTEREAVFSTSPGIDVVRPRQTTPLTGLFLAGDWTATGWPGTMEGAVRSGRLAAEGVLAQRGRPEGLLTLDLPTSLPARKLFRL